ncbi:hypothetical protein N0O92_05280 [Alkalihalobacillus sp. MEB130]|uniref:hypothetical protein n=1 Tax=Alkalihalobacillus sp. MEB130 TaxID=2976704 RepID=UPI0028DE251F|nr:hypothetical protein [Alkalihalobacillus sp. MEB130]MDT8859639.1 hypothetical protein [Alkalihalobacillus sp. MEB130]
MTSSWIKQKEAYYELLSSINQNITSANQAASHLGIETRVMPYPLFKEQVDQIEEIRSYFKEVNMSTEQMTNEAILTLSLKHFHQFIVGLKTDT